MDVKVTHRTILVLVSVHLLSGLVMDKNCSCVTKDEVFDLWDRVESLESIMNQTETFPIVTNSSLYNASGDNYLGNTNKTLAINQGVITENKEKTLAVYNVSEPGDNVDVLTRQVVSKEYTTSSWNNRQNPEKMPENQQVNNSRVPVREPTDGYSSNYKQNRVKDKQTQQQTNSEILLSDALRGKQMKLNHSLLSATYSSILNLRDRINELNSSLQDVIAGRLAIITESHELNHSQKAVPPDTHRGDNRSALNERDNPIRSTGELIKLVTALEERLNGVESKISAPDPTPKQGWPAPDGCEGIRKHQIGDACYSVPLSRQGSKAYTWWDGRFWCKENLGDAADLASIQNEQEMQNVIKLLRNHFGDIEEFWLGGNDLDHEGDWTWISSGNKVSYTYWNGAPASGSDKNCMSMLAGYRWTAEPCYFDRYPLCKLTLS